MKKFFAVLCLSVVAACCIWACVACGGGSYTVTVAAFPEGVARCVFVGYNEETGVEEGTDVQVRLYLEEGYAVGSLTVIENGTALEMTRSVSGGYYSAVIEDIREDIFLSFSGETGEECSATFYWMEPGPEEIVSEEMKDLFDMTIVFDGEAYTAEEFKTLYTDLSGESFPAMKMSFSVGETLTIEVYAQDGANSFADNFVSAPQVETMASAEEADGQLYLKAVYSVPLTERNVWITFYEKELLLAGQLPRAQFYGDGFESSSFYVNASVTDAEGNAVETFAQMHKAVDLRIALSAEEGGLWDELLHEEGVTFSLGGQPLRAAGDLLFAPQALPWEYGGVNYRVEAHGLAAALKDEKYASIRVEGHNIEESDSLNPVPFACAEDGTMYYLADREFIFVFTIAGSFDGLRYTVEYADGAETVVKDQPLQVWGSSPTIEIAPGLIHCNWPGKVLSVEPGAGRAIRVTIEVY